MSQNLSKQEAREVLWRRGILRWKLDDSQKDLYNSFYNDTFKTSTWLLARRSGKSYLLCVLSIEACLKNKNTIIKFVAPTKSQLNTILRPLMRQILEDCPDDIKPDYSQKDYIYYFKNGSEIQLAGTDNNHAEKLRGGDSHIAIIDEARDCSKLHNVVTSILLPTTLVTKGKVILASTPPEDEEHDFMKFIESCEARGSLFKRTVYDNPRLSKKDIEELITELGGITSEATRRELLCEIIKNPQTSVLPEVTEELLKKIVVEYNKPPFYDSYVAMDIGGSLDFTAIIFAYYDFLNDKVIIEDELIYDETNMEMNRVANDIHEKEKSLWFNPLTNEVIEPTLRVSDNNFIALNEISKASHGKVAFIVARKDDKHVALNNLRTLFAAQKIIINPRCKNLLNHIKHVKWANPNKKDNFKRSEDNGHYDFVDALLYLSRHVYFGRNPYPANYKIDMHNTHFRSGYDRFKNDQMVNVLKKVFNTRK